MNIRRVGLMAVAMLSLALWMACGQVYRPVVIPTTTTPPNPANFHSVFAFNDNVPFNPGTAMQIDVHGDSVVAATGGIGSTVGHIGMHPTHAMILPNLSRVYVTNAGTLDPNGTDVVSSFSPEFSSSGLGFTALTTFTFPNTRSTINPNTGQPFFCSFLPDFVAAAQSNTVYVANFGVESNNCDLNSTAGLSSTDSVAVLSDSLGSITNIVYLPAGSHPVALAEVQSPTGDKLYVANQGTNSINSFNTLDMSTNPVTGFSGSVPVWIVGRGDGHKVYVVTQGDGSLITIDTATDTVTSSLPVGAGANFISYDPHLQRLYVTNPANSTVFVFSAAGDAPTLLRSINLASSAVSGNYPTCVNPCPVSVAALPDGSRFYVASYEVSGTCPDANVAGACVIPRLTVIDTLNFTLKVPSMFLLTSPPFAASQYAVPFISSRSTTSPYTPGSVRFRVFAAAAADSSRVQVSIYDAGVVAVVNTTTNTISSGENSPDTLVTDLLAPFSAGPPAAGGQPPPQNPIFLLTGQ